MHTLGTTQRGSRPGVGLQAILSIGWAAFSVFFGLLPAMYYSASLAQTVGLWWDRL